MEYHFTAAKYHGHVYAVIYPATRCLDASGAVGQMVGDPKLGLDWLHAVPMLRRISEVRMEYLENEGQRP